MGHVHRRTALALGSAAALVRPALGQGGGPFPNRPIRAINPFAAGGSTDVQMRSLRAPPSPRLGHPVVVENRPGGGGFFGMMAPVNEEEAHGHARAGVRHLDGRGHGDLRAPTSGRAVLAEDAAGGRLKARSRVPGSSVVSGAKHRPQARLRPGRRGRPPCRAAARRPSGRRTPTAPIARRVRGRSRCPSAREGAQPPHPPRGAVSANGRRTRGAVSRARRSASSRAGSPGQPSATAV